jgi:hypothetical protein
MYWKSPASAGFFLVSVLLRLGEGSLGCATRPLTAGFNKEQEDMKKSLALALALAVAPFAASADALSYTYVEGGYAKLHIDDEFTGNPEGDGAFLRGSFEIGSGVYLLGGVSRVSEDFQLDATTRLDVDLTQYEFGVGYHQAMSDRVDFLSELAYVRGDVDVAVTGFGSGDESLKGGRLAVGIRGQMAENFEGTLKANYYDGGDFEDTFSGTLGLQYKFNPTWGIVGEVEVIEDATKYLVGVRASF